MTGVKICGIRRREDAELAVELGAWALGFIFHRASPRWIAPEDAAPIVRGIAGRALAVGVFVDWPLDDLNRIVAECGLSAAQLHGTESVEYCAGVRAGEVWKAFRVGGGFVPGVVEPFADCARVLLDTHRQDAAGGTGETFDWSLARRVAERRPIVLAGGIGPDNVARAIAEVGPESVDVSSGVEVAPGIKSEEKMRRLFAALEARI